MTTEAKSVLAEIQDKKDPQLDSFIRKLIANAKKQGIDIENSCELDKFLRKEINRICLGPFGIL